MRFLQGLAVGVVLGGVGVAMLRGEEPQEQVPTDEQEPVAGARRAAGRQSGLPQGSPTPSEARPRPGHASLPQFTSRVRPEHRRPAMELAIDRVEEWADQATVEYKWDVTFQDLDCSAAPCFFSVLSAPSPAEGDPPPLDRQALVASLKNVIGGPTMSSYSFGRPDGEVWTFVWPTSFDARTEPTDYLRHKDSALARIASLLQAEERARLEAAGFAPADIEARVSLMQIGGRSWP